MRKLLTWLAVTLGIAALVRKLGQRRAAREQVAEHVTEQVPGVSPPPEPVSAEPADQPQPDEPQSGQPQSDEPQSDPAAELRQKLAESRSGEAPAPGPSQSASEAGSVEERRAEVHEQGRAALDEMQPPAERSGEG